MSTQDIVTAEVEEVVQKIADSLEVSKTELSEALYDKYAEKDDMEKAADMADSLTTEDSTEEADNEEKQFGSEGSSDMKDGQIQCDVCGKVVDTEQAFYAHMNKCNCDSQADQNIIGDSTEDNTEDNTEENTEDTPVPYGNTDNPNILNGSVEAYYDNSDKHNGPFHPNAVMTRKAIKAHSGFNGETDPNALQHHQMVHGVCENCGLWAAMNGDTCNMDSCTDDHSGNTTDSTNAELEEITAKQFPEASPNEISEAVMAFEKGIVTAVSEASSLSEY